VTAIFKTAILGSPVEEGFSLSGSDYSFAENELKLNKFNGLPERFLL
jgi:hypothetical protein